MGMEILYFISRFHDGMPLYEVYDENRPLRHDSKKRDPDRKIVRSSSTSLISFHLKLAIFTDRVRLPL